MNQGTRYYRFMKKNQRLKISCYCPFNYYLPYYLCTTTLQLTDLFCTCTDNETVLTNALTACYVLTDLFCTCTDNETVLTGLDCVLWAVGRTPNTDKLNCGAAGIQLDKVSGYKAQSLRNAFTV